jgi:regulator of protease activity HflC (stomatin/prohibitin superfamily)
MLWLRTNGIRIDNEMRLTILASLIVSVALFMACIPGQEKVDVGYAGVIIDYTKGHDMTHPAVEPVPPGTYKQINPLNQVMAKFPIGQNSMPMQRKSDVGAVKGDDSVECADSNGVILNVDSTTIWRVDADHVGELYLLHPKTPLRDKFNADIESLVVRGNARSAIVDGCSQFLYHEIYGPKRVEVAKQIENDLRDKLRSNYILLDQFQLGEIYLRKEQSDAISAQATAQQNAVAATYTVQKAKADADAVIAKAEGDKQQAIKAAEAQAESTRIKAEAEANANIQVAKSITPQLIDYQRNQRWDGKLPQTIFGGTNSITPSVFFPVPTP